MDFRLSWEVSYADAVWQPAHLASTPRPFGKGNPMRSAISFKSAWQNNWWIHVALLLASILIAWVVTRLAQRSDWLRPAEAKYSVLGGLIIIWIVTLVHNFTLLPPVIGFDAQHHLNYIRIIQERGELPKADEGWETHQPPLYYLTCASLLRMVGLQAATAEGLMGLRVIGLLIGLGQILLVFASLRLLFPGELRRPLLGAGMAAVLPAHLYHAHYVTNETLLALFITAAFYFSLRVIRSVQFSPLFCAALGACMGAALMTKLSALLFLPVLFAALLMHLLSRNERSVRVWAGTLALPFLICLLIGGRYYWQLCAEGGPFANSSRWGYGSAWWQEDGYRIASYYFRFGRALFHPLYSSFYGFWDGMYSTLWGDALCGGSTSIDSAPPWNYELLTIGYWLALLPTLAVAMGFVIVIGKLLRRPSSDWLLLIGVTMLLGFAAIYFSLVAPGASQVRASFGLMLLVPFCALFAFGFDRVVSWKRIHQDRSRDNDNLVGAQFSGRALDSHRFGSSSNASRKLFVSGWSFRRSSACRGGWDFKAIPPKHVAFNSGGFMDTTRQNERSQGADRPSTRAIAGRPDVPSRCGFRSRSIGEIRRGNCTNKARAGTGARSSGGCPPINPVAFAAETVRRSRLLPAARRCAFCRTMKKSMRG